MWWNNLCKFKFREFERNQVRIRSLGGLTLKQKSFLSLEDSSGAWWETFEGQRLETGRPERRLGWARVQGRRIRGREGNRASRVPWQTSPPPGRTLSSLPLSAPGSGSTCKSLPPTRAISESSSPADCDASERALGSWAQGLMQLPALCGAAGECQLLRGLQLPSP